MELLILLLSMFVMAKEEEKPIDYPVIDNVQLQLSTDPGIATPKIDARVWTNNRYLESIFATDSSFSLPDSTDTTVTWFTFEKFWNINWKESTSQITIPSNWTYNITALSTFDLNADWLRRMIVYKNSTVLIVDFFVCNWVDVLPVLLKRSEPFNLSRWDIITIVVYQSSWNLLTTSAKLKIVKLS